MVFTVPDLLATVGLALGIDVHKQNQSNVGRPIRIVEPNAKPAHKVANYWLFLTQLMGQAFSWWAV